MTVAYNPDHQHWTCPNCGADNVDDAKLTALPICAYCNEGFSWDELQDDPYERIPHYHDLFRSVTMHNYDTGEDMFVVDVNVWGDANAHQSAWFFLPFVPKDEPFALQEGEEGHDEGLNIWRKMYHGLIKAGNMPINAYAIVTQAYRKDLAEAGGANAN